MISAQMIINESLRMQQIAENVIPVSTEVLARSKALAADITTLKKEIGRETYSEDLVKVIKIQCNKSALALEHGLAFYFDEFHQRILERRKIECLYGELIRLRREQSGCGESTIAWVELSTCLAMLVPIYERAQDIVFKLTEQDSAKMEFAAKRMEDLRK